jgi:AcrR family transcriptional regulator
MPIVTEEHQRRQRCRILEQAVDVFAERGYGTATVDEICRRAGLSKGALYSYFPSKQELFVAASQEVFERRYASIAAMSAGEGRGSSRIPALVDRLAAYVEAEDRAFIRLWVEGYLLSCRIPALEEVKTAYRHKFGDLLATVVRAGQDAGDIDPRLDPVLAADTVTALADGLLLHSLVPGWAVDIRRLMDSLSDLAVLGPKPSEPVEAAPARRTAAPGEAEAPRGR